jgi:hypothetical protein
MTPRQIELPNVPLFIWRNRATVDKKQVFKPVLTRVVSTAGARTWGRWERLTKLGFL